MYPVLIGLPLWAVVYLGAFGPRGATAVTPLSVGASVFAANCASCHGARGEGGVGPALATELRTFPKLADQISWVNTGSGPFKGTVYGGSGRVATGGMPPFKDALSAAQIADVVCYERVTFAGGNAADNCPTAAGTSSAAAP